MGKLLAGVILYLLTCGRCWAPFAICASCYRGHRYCGAGCRRGARIESRRASNRRHQQSELGRLLGESEFGKYYELIGSSRLEGRT